MRAHIFHKANEAGVDVFLEWTLNVMSSGDIPLRSRNAAFLILVKGPEFVAARMQDHRDDVARATQRKTLTDLRQYQRRSVSSSIIFSSLNMNKVENVCE